MSLGTSNPTTETRQVHRFIEIRGSNDLLYVPQQHHSVITQFLTLGQTDGLKMNFRACVIAAGLLRRRSPTRKSVGILAIRLTIEL